MNTQKKLLIAARNINKSTGTGRTIIQHCRYFTEQEWAVIIAGEALDHDSITDANGIPRRTIRLPFGKSLRRRVFSFQVDSLRAAYQPHIVWGHGDNHNQDILSLHNCVHLAHEVMSKIDPRNLGSVAPLHERQLTEAKFKLLIANSELMRQDVRERFFVPKEKIQVIHPGYDPKQFNTNERNFNRTELRRQWDISSDAFVLGLITSGDFAKRNVRGCLQAFQQIVKEHADTRLIVVGKAGDYGELKQFLKEFQIEDNVIVMPPRKDIERVYQALDLCVHPAHIEEFGQVVQEAVMCGTPVLTSRMVGATDLFPTDPKFVVLGRPNVDDLVRGIKTFMENKDYPRAHWEATFNKMKHNTWDYNFAQSRTAIEDAIGL